MNERSISKKCIAITMALVIMMGLFAGLGLKPSYAADNSKIVIVHTNDIHCTIDKSDKSIGYESVAGYRNQLQTTYSNVELVDAGDSLQGKPVGILTTGEDIVSICNAAKYGVIALGNHDFDYGVERLLELKAKATSFEYVSCNFIDLRTGNPVFDPYVIKTYSTSAGDKKVAYLGITTPETVSLVASSTFKDDKGNYIYSLCQDSDGSKLINCVQDAVNSARTEGADYVIVLGHLGQDSTMEYWSSKHIINNTEGIDAFIDGHTHQEYSEVIKNKNNEDVIVAQVGAQNVAVGVLTIDVATGELTEEIKTSDFTESDESVKTVVQDINENLNKILNSVVAKSDVDLYALQEDGYNWLVRVQETNLGDLVADAFREELEADVSLVNAGGIRSNISKGDITNNNLLSVLPFNNDTAVIKATGQQILDALEKGAMNYPDQYGGFMQVSGITYEIVYGIPSGVVLDENGGFVKVNGAYRVRNVKVNGQPLDLNKKYTVASIKYLLLQAGDGMTMFQGCEVVNSCGPKDFEVFKNYVNNKMGGVIDENYADKNGQGRIVLKEKEDAKPVDTSDESELVLYVVLMLISLAGGIATSCAQVKYK